MDFSISVLKIEEKNASLDKLIPDGGVKGKKLSSKYVIYPKEGKITIIGDNEARMRKCAKSITRNLARKQNWGFYYDLRLTKITDDTVKAGTAITLLSNASISSPPYDDKATVEGEISKEYALPIFYDLLFQEAIFNKSMKKHRIAFLLAFSALESAVKLLCEHHCKVSIARKSVHNHFEDLEKAGIKLKTNVTDFNDGSRFKRIRNDIAHGSSKFSDKDVKNDLTNLLGKADEIFRELSPLLVQHEHCI